MPDKEDVYEEELLDSLTERDVQGNELGMQSDFVRIFRMCERNDWDVRLNFATNAVTIRNQLGTVLARRSLADLSTLANFARAVRVVKRGTD